MSAFSELLARRMVLQPAPTSSTLSYATLTVVPMFHWPGIRKYRPAPLAMTAFMLVASLVCPGNELRPATLYMVGPTETRSTAVTAVPSELTSAALTLSTASVLVAKVSTEEGKAKIQTALWHRVGAGVDGVVDA